ncbi:MAG: hypothetical protein Q9222_002848 [Ikaeria aurantiellina]
MHRLNDSVARSYRLLSRCRLLYQVNKSNKAFATSIQNNDSSSSRPPKVTWYQQLYPGANDRQKIRSDEEDADGPEIAQELRERIAQLEEELGGLRGDGTRNAGGGGSLIDPLLEKLSDADRQKVRHALQQAELSDAEKAEVEAESETITRRALGKLGNGFGVEILRQIDLDELDVTLELAPEQKAHLRRFNTCLKKAADKPSDSKARKDLWVSYERCKRLLPSFIHHIPQPCWKVLWNSQHGAYSESHERAVRLSILAHDIVQSGSELTVEQRALIIDGFLDEGRIDEARYQWELQQHSSQAPLAQRHGLQGVRIFVSKGDLDKAQEVVEQVFNVADPDTARCAIPIIEALAARKTGKDLDTAWRLYLNLRTNLGSRIEINDFDRITMGFINAGKTDVALAVFKDMMLTGRESQYSSNKLYKTSLGLLATLQSRSVSPSEITTISLSALTTLPRPFQNKFFYGSWIKKLIGLGEIDAAVSVVELMYERGVTPDAKHVNGIIGAWLRSGQPTLKQKAEQLGWAMIQQRINLVQNRRGARLSSYSSQEFQLDIEVPTHIQRIVPPATIETFSLLLLHYERRSKSDDVRLLKGHLDLAEIPPNSYFMNHLLYAELRRGQHQDAWQLYETMQRSVKPDLETFACLWDCEKAHLDKLSMYSEDDFPGPRAIFRHFANWFACLDKRSRAAVHEGFSEELYNQIVRCVCLSKDLEGTVVALYGLRQLFHFLPNDETLRMIPMQVARIGLEKDQGPRKRRRSRLSDLTGNKAMIANVTKVFDVVVEQRIEVLQQKGIKLEECDVQRQNEEQIYVLADFLRVVMRRYVSDERAIDERIVAAAEEMGVGDIDMQDPLHSVAQP